MFWNYILCQNAQTGFPLSRLEVVRVIFSQLTRQVSKWMCGHLFEKEWYIICLRLKLTCILHMLSGRFKHSNIQTWLEQRHVIVIAKTLLDKILMISVIVLLSLQWKQPWARTLGKSNQIKRWQLENWKYDWCALRDSGWLVLNFLLLIH